MSGIIESVFSLISGTSILLDACVTSDVGLFIACSTQDSAIDWSDQCDVDETHTVEPCDLAFGDYAKTKLEAEQMVLARNGTKLDNGNDLFLEKEFKFFLNTFLRTMVSVHMHRLFYQ